MLPVPAVRVNGRTVLVSPDGPGGPAVSAFGLYARVTSHDQKADRDRQVARLTGWVADTGGQAVRLEAGIGSAMRATWWLCSRRCALGSTDAGRREAGRSKQWVARNATSGRKRLLSVAAGRMADMSGKPLRRIGDPVVAAPPVGVRIRTRLHLSDTEAAVLTEIGEFLGRRYRVIPPHPTGAPGPHSSRGVAGRT